MENLMIRILAAAFAFAFATAAFGQAYPVRPVTLVNGFPPGGATDVVLRQIASKLGERLGQPAVVENRPGAAGTIAAAAVSRAAPDGYTLLFGVAANLAVGPATMQPPPYDPTRAFTPIVEVSRGPYLWMVRADAPARTMKEFVEWTRAHPGKANYASPGQGSVHHLATEMFKRKTGADLSHVPYKGGAALTAALLAGEVHGLFDSPTAYLAHLRAGKIRALAVTGERRLPALPEVPTLAEQGLPTLDVHSWWGFVGPAGMPAEIVARLNAEITNTLADPDLKATLAKLGTEPTPGTPEAFRAYIAQEWARWREFVATSGLKF
jgi:tripartite-type tricarboxylate transporter receptor subunit TctC